MSGIHVLSDILKGGNKTEKTASSKGKNAVTSPENATIGFAAVLSGRITPNADSKGQNSSKAGQDSEKKQSTIEPVQSTQNPQGLGSMFGYGIFALPFLAQMLQRDLPAGKEANSGNDVSQGTEGLATGNALLTKAPIVSANNLELALSKLLSLVSDEGSAQSGMTTQKPQGDNPATTELDKYRQVIADLLVALSGEITDNSPKTSLGSVTAGTKALSQDIAKIVQGWMTATGEGAESLGTKDVRQVMAEIVHGGTTATDEGVNDGQEASANPTLNAKVATLLAALNPILSQGSEEIGSAKTTLGMDAKIQTEGDSIAPEGKESSESYMKLLMGIDLKPVVTQVKDTAPLTNVQQKSNGVVPQQGTFRADVQKVDSKQPIELSGGKDVQNSTGIGVASNIGTASVIDGKTVALPVWEQISKVVSEQVMNKSQDLKQLDIQLHPADLGKIQIALRWENGQVHLQVQASEPMTGRLLQNQLPELRQTLTNQGVNCGMLQMGQGGERQHNPHGDESRRTFNQNTQLNEDEDLIPVINSHFLGQDEINLINIRA